MVTVRILKNTVANMVPVYIGDIVDLIEYDAAFLIGIGKAEPYVQPKKKVKR